MLMMRTKKSSQFLIVIEDAYLNKDSVVVNLGEIGKQIKKFCKDFEYKTEEQIDYEKYNSDDPYDIGTFGLGFYDIGIINKDLEYGRIMIFCL